MFKKKLLPVVFAAVFSFSCTPDAKVEEATLTLDKTYADLSGEEGSTTTVNAQTNCSAIIAEKEDAASSDWFSISVKDLVITVSALSSNDGTEERWGNVIVKTDDPEKTGVVSRQFTVRQSINSDAVMIVPEKLQPVLSAAAYGETSGYGGIDNRYKVVVTLSNTDDFDIDWDKTATWLTNVEKFYNEIDGNQILGGIMISAEMNQGTEAREATVTLSSEGVSVELTVNQKSNPFKVEIGDYDAANGGTVVYLDIENYNFYLLLDNVELRTPFYGVNPVPFELPVGATSPSSNRFNLDAYYKAIGDQDFNSEMCPAWVYAFNRNAPEGTEYRTLAEVPAAAIDDETLWHLPTRNELAYVFKRTIYEKYVTEEGNTFNDVLSRNAQENGVEITLMEPSGTLYWCSQEQQSGGNAGKIIGYATTNLSLDKKNDYSYYPYSHTGGTVRCVKKVIVDNNQ